MRRLATFAWRTPGPTSIDEELALFDDDSARLVVRASRALGPAIGTYRAEPTEADREALLAAGPGPIEFNLLMPPGDQSEAALRAVADRVSDLARQTPEAVATFHARGTGTRADGMSPVSLLVVGSGTRPVQFDIDPAASSVQFSQTGQPTGWVDLPELPSGFVTPDAELLGGIRRRAVLEPGAFGAIAFKVRASGATDAVSIRVAGRLSKALPDDDDPGRFSALTEATQVDS